MWIDHVIFSSAELDASQERLWRRFGLAAYDGGTHPELGTANRIVPLGRCQYLELLGIADTAVAAGHPTGRWAMAAAADGDRPIHWNVGTTNIRAAARKLARETGRGTRILPDGSVTRFSRFGPAGGRTDPLLPFFICWDVPAGGHPGDRAVPHRRPVHGLAWLEVAAADEVRSEQLHDWLGAAELPVRVTIDEPEGVRAVGVAVDGLGEVVLAAGGMHA